VAAFSFGFEQQAWRIALLSLPFILLWASAKAPAAGTAGGGDLAARLRALPTQVIPQEERSAAEQMLPKSLEQRLHAANARSTSQWHAIRSREGWQRFRDAEIRLLREALGPFPQEPCDLGLRVASTTKGEGVVVRNLVFQSRPGLWVTANLYAPARPLRSMPGLLICHAHHTPKEHGELQDMGRLWARAGCLVLVPDLLGHGERRQHPFRSEKDYDQPFRVGRQDYYFRYDLGMQLHVAGGTLMGWFVWDLRRCVDALLVQPGVDAKRIVILGSVAGGGDPAAVAAALDERIAGAVVYNFGGAQPETPYPLPENAEAAFHYAGGGSFESTRNLRRSAADGFLPWVIVGAAAPRVLVYAHEFAWDRPHDPVWKRLEAVWGFYGVRDRLAGIHGRGSVKGSRPQSTHCTHIGPVHRESIHPLFERWFGIRAGNREERVDEKPPTCTESVLPPERAKAGTDRHSDLDTLRCMTPELERQLEPKRLCDLLTRQTVERTAALRQKRATLSPAALRDELRRAWTSVLGSVASPSPVEVVSATEDGRRADGIRIERVRLGTEPGIVVPLVLLTRRSLSEGRCPVVVAVAHAGKDAFLKHRAATIAGLLAGGAALCLPDLRGLGETKPEGSRERWGALTNQASTALMLGDPLVAGRLRDLRGVLAYLRGRKDIDASRIALWGDSFAEPNPPDRNFRVPRNVDDRPRWSEPLGGLLALLGALFEDDVCAVYARGGLSDFASVLAEPFVYIPPDAVIPGVLTIGDLPDLAAALAPRPLRMDGLVDGFNRVRPAAVARGVYHATQRAYAAARVANRLLIHDAETPPAEWLLERLVRE